MRRRSCNWSRRWETEGVGLYYRFRFDGDAVGLIYNKCIWEMHREISHPTRQTLDHP
jgi:hypothetical protein